MVGIDVRTVFMKNPVKFELVIDVDVCWLSLLTYVNQRLEPLLRNIPYSLDIPDSFLVDNDHPRCVEFCELMAEVDTALSKEELEELELMRKLGECSEVRD